MAIGSVVSYQASDLPTKHVTVYADRAEVNKTIKTQLKTGSNEIAVTKLSRSLDNDSIRVEGHGKATISEVKFHEKRVIKEEEVKDREKELHESLKSLREERKTIEQSLDRTKKQREILDGVASQIGHGPKNEKQKDASTALITDSAAWTNLDNFMNFYDRRAEALDKSLNEIEQNLEKADEQISVAESHLSETYRCSGNYVKEVTIYVTAAEDCSATLDLFYVVRKASWKPSYDIRVQTDEPAMKIVYYGLIQQGTDEDWQNVKLTLSTATPMIGGQVPELGTTKVSFYKPPQPVPMPTAAARMYSAGSARSNLMLAEAESSAEERIVHTVAKFKENVTSATFGIEIPTNIPSDNAAHKVTIAIVDLKPNFEYETVPSKSTYAYFKAKAQNSSPYPLLAGPIAVFVNDSFVANSSLKSVNATESFDVSLGVDAAIKIDYKKAKKFNEESGLLTKSALLTHEQSIGLTNAKTVPVRITVLEPLPQSTEEKLKVNLIEPVPHKNEKGLSVIVNKNNNIEWLLTLAPQEKRDLIAKYQIEHPKGEQLEFRTEQ